MGSLVPHTADRPVLTGNSFLDSLPDATRLRLAPHLRLQKLAKHQVLAEPGVPIRDVFFPINSLISTIMHMEDGDVAEVGLAGHEGLSPLPLAFGALSSLHQTVVQIPEFAQCMAAATFLEEMENDAALRRQVSRYAEYSFAAATQFAACNGLHSIEGRYARWILMANDRVGTNELSLTHEYSAQMLGVRRASVTETAHVFSELGLIAYRRGVMSVCDRDRLAAVACECYAAVNDELFRLMGYRARLPVS